MDVNFNTSLKRLLEEDVILSPKVLGDIERKAYCAMRTWRLLRAVKFSLVAASVVVALSVAFISHRNNDAPFEDAIDLLAEIDGVQSAVEGAKTSHELLLAWQEAPFYEL